LSKLVIPWLRRAETITAMETQEIVMIAERIEQKIFRDSAPNRVNYVTPIDEDEAKGLVADVYKQRPGSKSSMGGGGHRWSSRQRAGLRTACSTHRACRLSGRPERHQRVSSTCCVRRATDRHDCLGQLRCHSKSCQLAARALVKSYAQNR